MNFIEIQFIWSYKAIKKLLFVEAIKKPRTMFIDCTIALENEILLKWNYIGLNECSY